MKKYFFVVFILTTFLSLGQIYSEDFTGQDGKGAYGPTPTTDVSGVTWTVDISNAVLSASDDYIKVVSGKLEARDTDGTVIWLSPSINISSYAEVDLQELISLRNKIRAELKTTSNSSKRRIVFATQKGVSK